MNDKVNTILCKTSEEAILNAGNNFPKCCCDQSLMRGLGESQQRILQKRCDDKRALINMELKPTASYDMSTGIMYYPAPKDTTTKNELAGRFIASSQAWMFGGPLAIVIAMKVMGVALAPLRGLLKKVLAGRNPIYNSTNAYKDELKKINEEIEKIEKKPLAEQDAERLKDLKFQKDICDHYIKNTVKDIKAPEGVSVTELNREIERFNERIKARLSEFGTWVEIQRSWDFVHNVCSLRGENIYGAGKIANMFRKYRPENHDIGIQWAGDKSLFEHLSELAMGMIPVWEIIEGQNVGKAIGSNMETILSYELLQNATMPLVKAAVMSLVFTVGNINATLTAMDNKSLTEAFAGLLTCMKGMGPVGAFMANPWGGLKAGASALDAFRTLGLDVTRKDISAAIEKSGFDQGTAEVLASGEGKNIMNFGIRSFDSSVEPYVNQLFLKISHSIENSVTGVLTGGVSGGVGLVSSLSKIIGGQDARDLVDSGMAAGLADGICGRLFTKEGLEEDIDALDAEIKAFDDGVSRFGKRGIKIGDKTYDSPTYESFVEARDAKIALKNAMYPKDGAPPIKITTDPPGISFEGGMDLGSWSGDFFEEGGAFWGAAAEEAAAEGVVANQEQLYRMLYDYIENKGVAEGAWADDAELAAEVKRLFRNVDQYPKNLEDANRRIETARRSLKDARSRLKAAQDNVNKVGKDAAEAERAAGNTDGAAQIEGVMNRIKAGRQAARASSANARSVEGGASGKFAQDVGSDAVRGEVKIGSDRFFGKVLKDFAEKMSGEIGDTIAGNTYTTLLDTIFKFAKGAGLGGRASLIVGGFEEVTAEARVAAKAAGLFERMSAAFIKFLMSDPTGFGAFVVRVAGVIKDVITFPIKAVKAILTPVLEVALVVTAVGTIGALGITRFLGNIPYFMIRGIVDAKLGEGAFEAGAKTIGKTVSENLEKRLGNMSAEAIGDLVRNLITLRLGSIAESAATRALLLLVKVLIESIPIVRMLFGAFMVFQIIASIASMIYGMTRGMEAEKHIWENMLTKDAIANMLKSLHDQYKTFLPKTYDGSEIAAYSLQFDMIEDSLVCSNYDQKRCEAAPTANPLGIRGPAQYGQTCIWTYSHFNDDEKLDAANKIRAAGQSQADAPTLGLMESCQIKNQNSPDDFVQSQDGGDNIFNTDFQCGAPTDNELLGYRGKCRWNQTCWTLKEGEGENGEEDECGCFFTTDDYPVAPTAGGLNEAGAPTPKRTNSKGCQKWNLPENKKLPAKELGINWESIRMMYVKEYIMNLEYNSVGLEIAPYVPNDGTLMVLSKEEYWGSIETYDSLLLKISNNNTIIANFLGKWGYVIFVVVFIIVVLFIIMN